MEQENALGELAQNDQPEPDEVMAAITSDPRGELENESLLMDEGELAPVADELDGSIFAMNESTQEATYEEFKFPEEMEVDDIILQSATEQFQTLGLSQEQAQGMVDLSPKITESIRNAQQREWDTTTSDWAKQIKNDPVFGGYNFKDTIAKAGRTLQKYDADGELKEFLVTTKAGNHPAMVKFLVNVDRATAESPISRGTVVNSRRELTDAEIFFPEQAARDRIARQRMSLNQ